MRNQKKFMEYVRQTKNQLQNCFDDNFELQDDEIHPNFISNDKIQELNHKNNISMKKLYQLMKKDKGMHIEITYPGGLDQFYKDIESGMYDD